MNSGNGGNETHKESIGGESGAAGGKSFFSGIRPHLAALTLAGIWILLFPLLHNPEAEGRLRGDSVQYFAYLQSIFEDGDIQFLDEYLELYPEGKLPDRSFLRLPTGYAANSFAPGAPLCWAPFYLGGKLYAGISGAPDRASELRILIAATRLGSRFYAALSLFLFFFILRRFFDPNYALLGALASFFCTAYYAYGLFNTLLSHNVAAFSTALFIWYVLRSGPERNFRQWLLAGLIVGFVALCRWQNAVIVVWLAVEQLPILIRTIRERSGALRLIGRYTASALVFFVVLLPQFILWWIIFGPFKTPLSYYINAVYWDRPEIINVLFSSRHGLLSWHPMVYLGLIGLFLMLRRERTAAVASIGAFAILLYLNSVTGDWWAGDSFGMRRFVSFSAIFAIGISAFAVSLKRWLGKWPQIVPIGLALFFVWWNLGSLEMYQSGGISHDRPPTFRTLASKQVETQIYKYGHPFTWPGSLIQAWAIGGGSPDEADWICSAYLFYRQNNLGGRIHAVYPSYRQGFSQVRGRENQFRLLEGRSGTLYISRFAIWRKIAAMIFDGTLREEKIEPGEVPIVQVLLNGEHVGLFAGESRSTRSWQPVYILKKFWRRGLNRIDLRLFVGRRDRLESYRAENGFKPESDTTIKVNEGFFSLRLSEIRFFRGKSTREKIRDLYRRESEANQP